MSENMVERVGMDDRPSGWQDDPFEGDWWLDLLLRIWFWVDRR